MNISIKKIEQEQISNTEVLLSEETAIPLDDNCADNVLMGLVAHELDSPEQYFQELARIIKPDGRLIVVEFAKVRGFGPPMEHRLDPETVDKWASDTGFAKRKTWKWSRSIVGWEYLAHKPAAT